LYRAVTSVGLKWREKNLTSPTYPFKFVSAVYALRPSAAT
jgi:hypothetical protein